MTGRRTSLLGGGRMRVLGMISGTSHDGIDVALVDFALDDSGVLHGRIEHSNSSGYPAQLRERLLETLPPAELTFAEVCALDTLIGQAFADAASTALAGRAPVDLVCSHGQTVYHWVDGRDVLGTLQIGQPAWIAERTGAPVLADVRIRDITAGGQGAPMVSLLDIMLLGGLPGRPAGLNLGGIANMTVLRPNETPSSPLAFDTGPANALLDAAALRFTNGRQAYDIGGALGAAGTVHEGLLRHLLAEAYYALPAPKTTGKELFHAAYLAAALERFPEVSEVDVMATLTALTAETVAAAARSFQVDTVVASGGGCENPTLMRALGERLPGVRLTTTAEFGAPTDTKEAVAFALIGWFTANGLPANVPSATGASAPRILGALTAGSAPLTLPTPVSTPPAELRLTGGDE